MYSHDRSDLRPPAEHVDERKRANWHRQGVLRLTLDAVVDLPWMQPGSGSAQVVWPPDAAPVLLYV